VQLRALSDLRRKVQALALPAGVANFRQSPPLDAGFHCHVRYADPLWSAEQLQSARSSLVKRLAKRLERSSLRSQIIFCGVDVSLNVRNNAIIGWQFHLYVLVEGRNTTSLQEALKGAFPPEPAAKSPYKFRLAADPKKAITYLYKSIFYRRSEYSTPKGESRTRIQPLKGPELRELLVFLDRFPIGTRLILRGVRRDGKHLIPTRAKQ
jgi:hypothetical protein